MTSKKWGGRALAASLLATALGACDFISVTERNPNTVPEASVDQLLVGTQVNAFFFAENNLARMAAIWTQQLAGTDRQFSLLDTYILKESDVDEEFSQLYTGGGLIDIRQGIGLAEAAGLKVYAGIFRVLEGYLMGQGASIWGDLPYTQAVNVDEFPQPALDKQEAVYAAVQTVLDQAIADLTAGGGRSPGVSDLVFNGSAARWAQVAWTLKARYYLHWVEAQRSSNAAARTAAQTACGGNCIDKAMAAVEKGINSNAANFLAVHGSAATSNNVWYQFFNERSGYTAAGNYLVELLKGRDDPRLAVYFVATDDGFIGSAPGENNSGASAVNLAPDAAQPIATCAENQFILAETHYYAGHVAPAQQALAAGVACEAARLGVTLTVDNTLTGEALLREIMTQKYIALFLNLEAWNDYKRTCLPAVTTYQGRSILRRFFYGQGERTTNKSIPGPNEQPAFNTNDPAGCSAGA